MSKPDAMITDQALFATDAELHALLQSDQLALPRPLNFRRNPDYTPAFCCFSWFMALVTFGTTCFCPVSLFCPERVTRHNNLRLENDVIVADGAVNDCCCHVAESTKMLPLEKVQDVQLKEDCCLTLAGLKSVRIETAGSSNPQGGPEVSVDFVDNPELTAEALRHALRLFRRGMASAPGQQGMSRGGGGGVSAMAAQLERLNQLASRGVISAAEAASVRAAVIAAPTDLTAKLADAEQLCQQGLITQAELAQVKDRLLRQLA